VSFRKQWEPRGGGRAGRKRGREVLRFADRASAREDLAAREVEVEVLSGVRELDAIALDRVGLGVVAPFAIVGRAAVAGELDLSLQRRRHMKCYLDHRHFVPAKTSPFGI